ncbi:MAG: hypothetical protein ACFHW5_18770 [Verrucomicrobiota bacterium]|jgi:hypothetical protein
MISFDIHGTRRLQPLLLKAYLWSILFHFVVIASLELAHYYGLTEKGPVSMLLAPKMPDLTAEEETQELEINLVQDPQPTIFFDADPSLATEDKPDDTPYYAIIDSLAGNPDTSKDMEQPELEGKQDLVHKTTDTGPSEQLTEEQPFESFQPYFPDADEIPPVDPSLIENPDVVVNELEVPEEDMVLEPEDPVDEETKETETSDTAEMLSNIQPRPVTPQQRPAAPPQERPKTLAEAKKRSGMLLGESMQQEGGVKRFRIESSPDLLATPFGAYDAAVIQAIQQRWFGLLEGLPSARNASGKVVVQFELTSTGEVREVDIEEDTVGVIQSLLCQRAISDPAPYGKWPSDMRRLVGADYRNIRFTFYYN